MTAPTGRRALAEPSASPRIPLRLVDAGATPPAGPLPSPRPLSSPTSLPSERSAGQPTGRPPLQLVDEAHEIRAICRSTVQAAIEVLAGTRPAQQLARRLDERCLAALQHRAALTRRVPSGNAPTAGRLHRNPSVRSVRTCKVAEDTYEASAVVTDELRVRAVALRLERTQLLWRVTVLEIG